MDHTDHKNFDFAGAALEIQSLGATRGESAVFADAVCALYFKAKETDLSAAFLRDCLGDPDGVDGTPGERETWEYRWAGFESIPSRTRFLVVGTKVVGVEVPRAA